MLISKYEACVESGEIDQDTAMMSFWDALASGYSTTNATFSSLINILIHHPNVQEKLRDEVVRVIGDRDVTYDDRLALHYHQAVIYEALRMINTISISGRKSVQPSELAGYNVPANTDVWMNWWWIHNDPETWGDPEQFRPERFLDEEGSLLAADHPLRRHFTPFGMGVRVCPGEVFAKVRLLLMLAGLVREFRILPDAASPAASPAPAAAWHPDHALLDGLVRVHPPYTLMLQPAARPGRG